MPPAINHSESYRHVTKRRKKRIVIPFRNIFKWLVRLRRSPRAIAGGFAMGVFIAFTPTIGIQIFLVILLTTLFNLNRPAGILSVWITNAATMAPIYTFNYWIGSFFWSGPPIAEVYETFVAITIQLIKLDVWAFKEQFDTILNLSSALVIPLVIGSFVVGVSASLLVYLSAITLIQTVLEKRKNKLSL